MLDFPTTRNAQPSQNPLLLRDKAAIRMKALLRETTKTVPLNGQQKQLVASATKSGRPVKFEQMMLATVTIAQHASSDQMRKMGKQWTRFLEDLSGRKVQACLRLVGREETVAESHANVAQYAVNTNYEHASPAELRAALHASRNQRDVLDRYCDALVAELAARGEAGEVA